MAFAWLGGFEILELWHMLWWAGAGGWILIKLKWLNIGISCLVGCLLWFIWQASTTTSPELQSILARFFLSKALFGHASAAESFFNNGAGKDWSRSTNPLIFLPVSMVASVAFSQLRTLPRFLLWLGASILMTVAAIYFFETFHIIIPYGGPFMLINLAYICGTLLFLEGEKIERGRALAIDLQIQAEGERKRIAQDLHDEVLPSLSRVMRLSDQLQEENAASSIPQEMRERLENTVGEMRRVINDLHPSVLENLGLSEAPHHLVDRLGHDTKIQTTFRDESRDLKLPQFHALCIYRIAQEALNNVEKHSQASHMVLALEKVHDVLRLSISDDGRGAPDIKKADSHGMQNITHRARLIGGKVEWKSPEKFATGTMLQLTVPLEQTASPSARKEVKENS